MKKYVFVSITGLACLLCLGFLVLHYQSKIPVGLSSTISSDINTQTASINTSISVSEKDTSSGATGILKHEMPFRAKKICTGEECETMTMLNTIYDKKDIDGCEKLPTSKIQNCKNYVLFLVATESKDVRSCETILDENTKKNCVSYIQYNYGKEIIK